MSYTEQSDYVPSNYPQRVTVEWRQVIKSLNPMRALRRWWHEYDQPVKQEPLLNVMSNTPVKRRIGRYEYDVYESKIPDAKTPKDRLTHPGWRQAFAHHP